MEDNPSSESGIESAVDALALRPASSEKGLAVSDNRRTDPNWMFMAFCAFQDFSAIREHLAKVWADHRAGKVDIVVA